MSEIVSAMAEFRVNGEKVPGYVAHPREGGPFPGVVVIQEWWGLNSQIKGVVGRFAQEGFVALAPDLYRGKVSSEPDEARKLRMSMEMTQAVKDIQGAVNDLLDLPLVQPKKIGVMGFCLGGRLATMMSYTGEGVGAVVVFYGTDDDVDYDAVSVPVLGLFGAEDHAIPISYIEELEQQLKQHNKVVETVIYAEAGHAFFTDDRASYNEEASEDAWKRTLAWFREYLKA